MALDTYILKNVFSQNTSNYKKFEFEDGEYYWNLNRLDGENYTCMRFHNEVKIFKGTIHHVMFHGSSIKPLIEFNV